jgi:lipid A disaccharide synthetase
VSLPNVILGESRYPELLQDQAEPRTMARAIAEVLERPSEFARTAEELRRRLAFSRTGSRPRGATSTERVAALISDWIGPP